MIGSTPERPNGAAIRDFRLSIDSGPTIELRRRAAWTSTIFLIFILLGAGASADVVTDWNEIMQNTVAASDPVVRSRSAAITQVRCSRL